MCLCTRLLSGLCVRERVCWKCPFAKGVQPQPANCEIALLFQKGPGWKYWTEKSINRESRCHKCFFPARFTAWDVFHHVPLISLLSSFGPMAVKTSQPTTLLGCICQSRSLDTRSMFAFYAFAPSMSNRASCFPPCCITSTAANINLLNYPDSQPQPSSPSWNHLFIHRWLINTEHDILNSVILPLIWYWCTTFASDWMCSCYLWHRELTLTSRRFVLYHLPREQCSLVCVGTREVVTLGLCCVCAVCLPKDNV